MICRRPLLLTALICLLASGAGTAWAQQEDRGHDRGNPPQAIQRSISRGSGGSLSDSVRRIERGRRGQVLSAERIPFDGREVHRLKYLDDRGRVRVHMDDPGQRQNDSLRRPDLSAPPPARGDDD